MVNKPTNNEVSSKPDLPNVTPPKNDGKEKIAIPNDSKLTPTMWAELKGIDGTLYKFFIKTEELDENKEYTKKQLDDKYEKCLEKPVFAKED
jgi:hypothetical protein